MIREQLTIQNKFGLHTRAAAKLVDTAKRFLSRIELVYQDRVVDCKGIMGVITLGVQKGNRLDVVLTGSDEQEAFSAIASLVDDKFGEE
ncbi:MAG TPA: HPr family phosphocarrier protein [Gammaproteobacteria bacterium]|jgi:phosphocarrier protein|nr:HPr family phosphocarrier protein [Gammaproteobacteria bacterium]